MSVMVYDLLLAGPRETAELAPALANAFGVPIGGVDVAGEDVDERNWSALVLVTYAERHGDVSLSLSITAVDGIKDRPTEAVLAARLAERLSVPVLYPAAEFPPSAYWLADGHGRPARARLEPSDELDPSVEDDLALTIDAVDRPVSSLPAVRVTPIPEVIREHRLPTPLADAFAEQANAEVGTPTWHAGNALGAWESFVTRLTSGWPPDGWYPADYYAQDLQSRDDADGYAQELTSERAGVMAAALHSLDETYDHSTVLDDGVALSAALGIPLAEISERALRWRRRPVEMPWP
jgi:hypothetical protein